MPWACGWRESAERRARLARRKALVALDVEVSYGTTCFGGRSRWPESNTYRGFFFLGSHDKVKIHSELRPIATPAVSTNTLPDSNNMKALSSPVRAVTFEITSTLVCMAVPLGKVYGDAVRHYNLPCPADDAMKVAFKAAYVNTGSEIPNFGAGLMSERQWWQQMISSTLVEAGCTEALMDETFPLVFQRIYSSFASPDVWAPCPEGVLAMRHAKARGLIVGAVSNVYPRYVDQNLPLLGLHRDLDFAATSYDVGRSVNAACFSRVAW